MQAGITNENRPGKGKCEFGSREKRIENIPTYASNLACEHLMLQAQTMGTNKELGKKGLIRLGQAEEKGRY